MIDWILEIHERLGQISGLAVTLETRLHTGEHDRIEELKNQINHHTIALTNTWGRELSTAELSDLKRHIHYGQEHDYRDIHQRDVPSLTRKAKSHAKKTADVGAKLGLKSLLHPKITLRAYPQFENEHYRDAVFNSIVAVFDLIRQRTGLDLDGASLAGKAFSTSDPYLVFSELTSESGLNEQKGFIQIVQGIYLGVRNPKAHTLEVQPTKEEAAQYLVFASLLARKVEQAVLIKREM